MTIEEVKDLLQFAKKIQLKRIRYGELEAEFSASMPIPTSEASDSLPSEDELLYWSTDYTPDIKANPPE